DLNPARLQIGRAMTSGIILRGYESRNLANTKKERRGARNQVPLEQATSSFACWTWQRVVGRRLQLQRRFVDGAANLLFSFSELLLKTTHQLIFVAFAIGEIVFGQLAVGLLELALDDVPISFDLQLIHMLASQQVAAADASREAISERFPDLL
ncbi:MAG TPA: hypothetical protein VIT18_03720, partial [Terrimicrobiaceae bacterium]